MHDKSLRTPIVEEYLAGGTSCGKLGKRFGIHRYTISRWVNAYLKQQEDDKITANLQAMQASSKSSQKPLAVEEELQQLRQQLEKERLRNKLLTAMIEVAEEELKIPIRKKYGARQCKK